MSFPPLQVWGDQHPSIMPRISFTEGSFFEADQIPAATSNSDVFTMRQILHDWSDEDGISILKKVRPHGKGTSLSQLCLVQQAAQPWAHRAMLNPGALIINATI